MSARATNGRAGSSVSIPADRYRTAEFAELERQRLWPKVWQLACSVDHVGRPGDVFEYRCGLLSVLIVRGGDGQLRGFQNVCRHRGNSLISGNANVAELRCPFHRWSWDLTGRLREVPSRSDFGPLDDESLGLIPVHVASWGRLVFVNLDLDAMPLSEWLEGIPDDIAWIGVDHYRCVATVVTEVQCNWKIVTDGFSETYHIQGLHREMLASIDDVGASQRLWSRHGVSSQAYGVASARLGPHVANHEVWDSFVRTQGERMGVTETGSIPLIAAGETVQDAIAARIRARLSERGVDVRAFDTNQMMRLHQYNLLPNATVLFNADMLNVICARPGAAPDRAEMVMLNFERAAAADAPRNSPIDIRLDESDVDFGLVINQDVALLRTAQRGVNQPGLMHLTVGSEECRLIHNHRNLDRFLGLSPADSVSDAASASGHRPVGEPVGSPVGELGHADGSMS